MKTRLVLVVLTVFLLCASGAHAAATAVPATITIAGGGPSTVSITYNLTEPASPPATASSTQGLFQLVMPAGPVTIETVNTTVSTPLDASVNPAVGTATETLVIPLSVIKKAEERGKTSIRYTRTFNVTAGTAIVTIQLTSPGTTPLNISGIRLYFENKRAEITVKRRQPGVKVYADINFTGKGLLKGYWQVDNRIVSYVNKNLVYGKSLLIATPDVPSLPTFSEGSHVVKFVVQEPEQGITLPRALYYVTPDETPLIANIDLQEPYDQAVLEVAPSIFKWQGAPPQETYLVEFMEEENGSPIYSAYTNRTEYTLPAAAIKYFFTSPQPYFWRVKGFDRQNNIAGESAVRPFRFKSE